MKFVCKQLSYWNERYIEYSIHKGNLQWKYTNHIAAVCHRGNVYIEGLKNKFTSAHPHRNCSNISNTYICFIFGFVSCINNCRRRETLPLIKQLTFLTYIRYEIIIFLHIQPHHLLIKRIVNKFFVVKWQTEKGYNDKEMLTDNSQNVFEWFFWIRCNLTFINSLVFVCDRFDG